MITTINNALSNKLIEVISKDDKCGVYVWRLGLVPIDITMRVVRNGDSDYSVDVSHRIKTPNQADGYLPAIRYCNSPGAALAKLISVFCSYYKSALKEGHEPNESWLVSNRYFDGDGDYPPR